MIVAAAASFEADGTILPEISDKQTKKAKRSENERKNTDLNTVDLHHLHRVYQFGASTSRERQVDAAVRARSRLQRAECFSFSSMLPVYNDELL